MTNNHKYYIKYWLPPLLYCLLIFLPSVFGISINWIKDHDNAIHVGVYAFLGVLIYRALQSAYKQSNTFMLFVFSVMLSSLVGVVDELFQVFSPSRIVDRVDVLYDFVGSLTGVLIYLLLMTVLKKRKRIIKSNDCIKNLLRR